MTKVHLSLEVKTKKGKAVKPYCGKKVKPKDLITSENPHKVTCKNCARKFAYDEGVDFYM